MKLTLPGLKELLLPSRATRGLADIAATGARALFQAPDNAMTPRRSLVEFLAQVSLFEDLGRRDLARVARIVHERDYSDGEYICEAGKPGAALFVVRRGLVEVVRRDAGGEEVPLALLEPPASFEAGDDRTTDVREQASHGHRHDQAPQSPDQIGGENERGSSDDTLQHDARRARAPRAGHRLPS